MKATAIKEGMTREDVKKLMSQDGGIFAPYKHERYYFSGFYLPDGKVCKIDIAFRPQGMPQDVYKDPNRFAEWLRTSRRSDPTDEVVGLSKPYAQFMIAD